MSAPFSYSEIMLLLATSFILVLWTLHRIKHKEIYLQLKRYPLFACRDAFIQIHLRKNLPEPVFQRLMELTNSALLMARSIDMRHFAKEMSNASSSVRNDNITQEIIRLAQKDPELKQQIVILFENILKIGRRNTLSKIPLLFRNFIKYSARDNLIDKTESDYKIIKDFSDKNIHVA